MSTIADLKGGESFTFFRSLTFTTLTMESREINAISLSAVTEHAHADCSTSSSTGNHIDGLDHRKLKIVALALDSMRPT
jgi:hypothetical protein